MSEIAIRVEGLSKRYRIGPREPYKALRDVLPQFFAAPFQWGRRNEKGSIPRKTDNWIWALEDVSFEIERGEVVGIIGRNGAGKTTLLKILSRITKPTKGYAEIHGRVGSLLEVGTGFHPELTGRENIYLNGAILGMTKREMDKKFDEIVAFAEVEQFIDTPVKYYSSGMYVRLAFAVAAHLEPEILLVDEVLAVGDINFQQKCFRKMDDISKKGRTVLLVSHNLRVVETLADRCLYLKHGFLVREGPVLEIVKQYQQDSSIGQARADLPSQFDTEITEPRVMISNLTLRDEAGRSISTIAPGSPVWLSFDLESTENISQPVVCVYVCRDKTVISGNNSDHTIGELALSKELRMRLDVKYESVNLIPGNYTIVVFVLPSYFSSTSDSLSDFHTLKMVVQGSRRHGGGYVCLSQNWNISDLGETSTLLKPSAGTR